MNASLAKFSLAGGAGQLGQVTYLSWFPQSMVASVGGGLILGKAWDILNFAPVAGLMAHSREMEWEADRSGHQVALASGAKQENVYNGMSEFLEFGRNYFNEPNGLFQKLLLSHPNWGDRTQKVKERYSEYWNSLKSFNTSNRLDEVFYKQYHSIHMEYKTGVERWGANNKSKSKSQNGQRLQSDYLAMSLMSPAGRCIIYALGGDLNLETEVPRVPSSWKPNATFKNH